MLLPKELPGYHSYLLRFWQEETHAPPHPWRFSLEDPHSGDRFGFRDLDALMGFLEQVVRTPGPTRP